MVFDKIKFQWKTVSRAFNSINRDASKQGINEGELKHYLNHWGFLLKPQQFKELFDIFDADRDGIISYKDFHNAIAYEIHPIESLYFRQDKDHFIKHTKCLHFQCWQACQGTSKYCTLHLQMYREMVKRFFNQLILKSNAQRWRTFIKFIREQVTGSDCSEVNYNSLVKGLHKYLGTIMSEFKRNQLLNSFGRQLESGEVLVDISFLLAMKFQA